MIADVLVPIVVIVVLVVVNGVFVAAEFALVGSRPSRLESLAAGGSRGAKWLLAVFDRPTGKDGYIAVAQLGITLASIGLGMYGEPAVAGWLYGPFEDWGLSHSAAHTVGFIVALSGITYLHVVLGEMIPKALALQAPERVSVKVNPFMRAFTVLFRPLVAVLNATALGLMRMLRIPEPDKRMSLYTSAELAIVTDEAADSGQLGAMQRDLIRNVFELDERTAEELMTPRRRVETIDINATSSDIGELIGSSSRSRYLVVDGSLDDVRGVLHIKDFIRAQQRGSSLEPLELARSLPDIAHTSDAETVLGRFQANRTHAALVVDEFGGALGMITMDDVINDVMEGEVDSGDVAAEQHDDGSISVAGELTLVELADDHGIEIEHTDVTTVAGVVLAETGVVPVVGTSVSVQGHELVVEENDDRRLTRIRIKPGG